jgi:molecular chaperone HscB
MATPDYFELFGLEPKLTIDIPDLEQRFYSLSRKLHPDRFLRATPAERARAEEATATLNDGYRTLRNPLSRAGYVLARTGPADADSKQVPPELLHEVFALNESLEELREGDASMRPQVEAARAHFLALLAEADTRLEDLFRKHDAGDPAAAGEIRSVLNRRRYVSNLLAQIERVLVP